MLSEQFVGGVDSEKVKDRSQDDGKEERYSCECGKLYSSFSALYLHVKFQHNKRLIPKQARSSFRTEEVNNTKVYKYYIKQVPKSIVSQQYNQSCLSQNKNQSQALTQNLSHSQKIQKFLEHFEKEGKNQNLSFNTCQIIMKGFMDYLQEVEKVKASDSQREIPEDIILFINEFIVYYVPEVRKHTSIAFFQRKELVKVMFAFGSWLKGKGLTDYTLAINAEEEELNK